MVRPRNKSSIACGYGVHLFRSGGRGDFRFHICVRCESTYVCTCHGLCIFSEEGKKKIQETQQQTLVAMAKYLKDEPLDEREKKLVNTVLLNESGGRSGL